MTQLHLVIAVFSLAVVMVQVTTAAELGRLVAKTIDQRSKFSKCMITSRQEFFHACMYVANLAMTLTALRNAELCNT